MVVVNLQAAEDDCNHRSGTSTTSIHEFASVNDSQQADLTQELIRLYEGNYENDRNHGSVESSSSIEVVPRVSALTEGETELMIGIYKDTIYPMICADINRKHNKFLFMVREKFGLDLLTGMTWNLCNMRSNLQSQSFQLKFLNGISTPVSTGKIIKGNEQKPFLVALIDGISGQIVTTGAEAAMEVEIVVLEFDSNEDEPDNWTSDQFNNKIANEWNGKKVLQGNTFVKLGKGTVSVDNIRLTHNSVWKGKRKCRIGARPVNTCMLTRVKEAKTEPFLVKDKRISLYEKHEIPSLNDRLYRLYKISHRSKCFKRLIKAHIKTVMDLLTLHAVNPQRLKDLLNVHPENWKIIINHARMCKDDKGVYLYHYPRDGQKSNGVVFNIYGNLVGIISQSCFVPHDNLPGYERVAAEKLIVSSSENWEDLLPFNDIDHLQQRTTVNSLLHNNLNVFIPRTVDPIYHTNLTSPESQSQSPKRPATEHALSNSPKQPRYDHPKLSPSTPMCYKPNNLLSKQDDDVNDDDGGDDDDDVLKYLDLFDRWKIVWFAVEWISMISKLRKRRIAFCHENTVIMTAASMEQHAQTCD